MTTSSNYRVSPQYSPHGKLEAYKVEKNSPMAVDWLGRRQQERWISVRTCMTKDAAEKFVAERDTSRSGEGK